MEFKFFKKKVKVQSTIEDPILAATEGMSDDEKIKYLVEVRRNFHKPHSLELKPMSDQQMVDYQRYITIENELREELSLQHDEAA